MISRLIQCLVLILLCNVSSFAAPDTDTASASNANKDCNHPAVVAIKIMIDDILQDLKGQLKKDGKIDGPDVYKLIDRLLVPNADLNTTAKLVLVNNWKKLNAAQQEKFIKEFSRQMIRTYGVAFQAYDGETVEFDCRIKKLSGGNKVNVTTKINHNKAPSNQVEFKLLNRNNNWLIYDLTIDGISIVKSYRTVYAESFRKKTPDQLLNDMHTNNCKDQKFKLIC